MDAQIDTSSALDAKHQEQSQSRHGDGAKQHDVKFSNVSAQLLEYQRLALRDGCTPAPLSSVDVSGAEIAQAQSPAILDREISALSSNQILYDNSEHVVAIARQAQIPHVVLEIGRLRELTFRQVGEGTGRALDLDEYDTFYEHLVAYNRATRQVLGSYRLAMTETVRSTLGYEKLYTRSLFEYDEAFLDQLGPAIELGRSFVRPEFQRRSRVLAMLWNGIGAIVARRPAYFNLFGPVSVSANYTDCSRQLIAAVLSRSSYRHPLASHTRALRPIGTDLLPSDCAEIQSALTGASGMSPARLSSLVAGNEADAKGLPTLVREYLKLSGRFLAFSIDPDFGSAMDGLVAVDLRRTNPRLLNLYMGNEAYVQFQRAAKGHPVAERKIA